MKKRFCLMLCILIGICAFLGCSGNDAGLKKVELHEVTRSVFYAPQYVAAGLGYFEEEGLSVNITTSGGSDKATDFRRCGYLPGRSGNGSVCI